MINIQPNLPNSNAGKPVNQNNETVRLLSFFAIFIVCLTIFYRGNDFLKFLFKFFEKIIIKLLNY